MVTAVPGEELSTDALEFIVTTMSYQFTVEHRRGVDNANADALSRLTASTDKLHLQEGGDVADYLPASAPPTSKLPDHSCKVGPDRTGFLETPKMTNQNARAPCIM